MKTKEVCDWVFACGQAAGKIEAGKEFRQVLAVERQDRELERAAWKKKVEGLKAELAKAKEESDDLRKAIADRILRGSSEPCNCATGPWVQGIPEVMDGRRVLTGLRSGGHALHWANGTYFESVTRYAEIRKGPE